MIRERCSLLALVKGGWRGGGGENNKGACPARVTQACDKTLRS